MLHRHQSIRLNQGLKTDYMRFVFLLCMVALIGFGCKEKPGVYKFKDLGEQWINKDTVRFKVLIEDTDVKRSLSQELRYSIDYEWSRLFIGFELRDSAGHQLDSGLVNILLFDQVTGEPKGKSGIGDLFEKSLLLKKELSFPYPGSFEFVFWQMMRRDTLSGITNLGIRLDPLMVEAP